MKRLPDDRRRLQAEYGELFDLVAGIMFKHDPAHISLENFTDEHHPETGTILPRLRSCHSVTDVQLVVSEELARWFGTDATDNFKNDPSISAISEDIWSAWKNSNLGRNT